MRKSLFGSLASVTLAAGVVFAATNAHAQVFSDSFADQTKQQTQQGPVAGTYRTTMTPDATPQFTVRTAANESGASETVTCSAPYARDTVAMSAGHMFTKNLINVTVGNTYCLSAWVRAAITGVGGKPYIGVQETATATGFQLLPPVGEHWLLAASGGFPTQYGVGDNATVIPLDGKWHWVSKAFQPTAATILIKTENYDDGAILTQVGPAARPPVDIDELTLTAGACPAAAPTLPLTNCTTGNLCDNATNTCVTCEVDNTVSPSAANKYACESSNPFCNSGKCGKCTSDLQCTTGAGHAGIFCDTGSGKCLPGCTDGSCGSLEWCALKNATAGQCSAKIANGSAVPANSAGADSGAGKCTPVVGLRVCLSGACDVDDNLCGLMNSKTCTAVPALDAGTGDAGVAIPTSQCRTGACQADGKCGVATGGTCTSNPECRSNSCVSGKCVATSCTTDANCGSATSGFICSANICVEGCRGASGNGCPSGQVCTSTSSTAGTCEPGSATDGGTTEPEDDSGVIEETPDSSTTTKDSGTNGGSTGTALNEDLEGGGLSCSSTNGAGGSLLALFGVVGIAVGAAARRRRK